MVKPKGKTHGETQGKNPRQKPMAKPMAKPMQRDDHDRHMNELTQKISGMLDGEDLFDVAMSSAAIMTFALNAMPGEKRAEVKKLLAKFIADLEAVETITARPQ